MNKTFILPLSITLLVSLLVWALGLIAWVNYAHAQMTSVKDVLSNSAPSVLAKHAISFTTGTALAAGETLKIQLDPTTDAFAEAFSSATTTDITTVGMTLVGGGVSSCTGATNEVFVTLDNVTTDENFTFTVCTGDTVTAGAKTITIGAVTKLITNPNTTGSFVIRLVTTGTPIEKRDARVAIVDKVTVTATVATNFTFTVSGVASGGANANGQAGTTNITTTATTIPWATLSSNTLTTARQDLAVSTNATNGFTVTLYQDQNLLSGNGADIDKFRDGTDGAPQVWAAPAATIDSEATYGHFGVTSEDATLSGGDTFGAALFDALGTEAAPLEIFFHTGPANGTTADKGATKIGFAIEISALQEAADDYTNALTYVATPTF